MVKNAKWALLLALMLGASTVFAACNDNSGSGKEDGEQTAQQEEAAMNEVYKERIDKWMQYVEYDEPEAVKSYELKKLKSKSEYQYEYYEKIVLLYDTVTEEDVTTKAYELYSTLTGNKILSFTAKNYTAVEKTADDVNYDVRVGANYIETVKWTYKLRDALEGETEVDATLPENYEETITYSYYDLETGKAIATGLKDVAIERENYVDIDDKTYLFDDGKIVATFEKGMEYALPSFNTENMQIVPGDYDEYVCFTQGDYTYRIDEAEYTAMQVGDVAMAIFPGVSVHVYKGEELVASYETDCYTVSGYGVMSNGNVYVCEYRQLSDVATEYDLDLGGMKFDVVHTVVDVATGAVNTVENAFVTSRVYTDATAQIKTSANVNTTILTSANTLDEILDRNNHIQGMKVKDGYVLAEVQKYENGALTGNSVYAVLNASTLEIVEELPKILASQFGYAGFVAENEMLFATKTPDNTIVRYTVNTQTGDLKLFTKNSYSIDAFDGGFLYDDVVYDYEWNKLADLADYNNVSILPNGKLVFVNRTEYNIGTTDYYCNYASYIAWLEKRTDDNWYGNNVQYFGYYDSEYVLCYKTFYQGKTTVTINENYMVTVNEGIAKYYDLDGNVIYEQEASKTEQKTVSEAGDSSKYVVYDVTTRSEIFSIDSYEFIIEVETWTEAYREGYGEGEEPTQSKNGQTYYQYSILK